MAEIVAVDPVEWVENAVGQFALNDERSTFNLIHARGDAIESTDANRIHYFAPYYMEPGIYIPLPYDNDGNKHLIECGEGDPRYARFPDTDHVFLDYNPALAEPVAPEEREVRDLTRYTVYIFYDREGSGYGVQKRYIDEAVEGAEWATIQIQPDGDIHKPCRIDTDWGGIAAIMPVRLP